MGAGEGGSDAPVPQQDILIVIPLNDKIKATFVTLGL